MLKRHPRIIQEQDTRKKNGIPLSIRLMMGFVQAFMFYIFLIWAVL